MGWSTWYAFGQGVTQAKVEASYRKLVNRSVVPGGKSLQDYGYVFANIDDAWQACHAGVDGSFHDAEGWPLVNNETFPNVSAMTSLAHQLGLKPGWYYNNYICGEGMPKGGIGGDIYMRNMRGNVDFLAKNGFAYVKVDSGSVYNNMTLWNELIEASGQPVVIENCHQGHELPTASWCPFNLFRTSGDTHIVGLDVEILATQSYLSLSRTNCWAYPDTLSAYGQYAETRSQFGVYAIMSSPLILSFDILDDSSLIPSWDIFTNTEAISVNQREAGSIGKMLRKWSPHRTSDPLFPWAEACNASDPAQEHWSYDASARRAVWQPPGQPAMCLASGGGTLGLEPCESSRKSQAWILEGKRLWQSNPELSMLEAAAGVGILELRPCNWTRPGQNWTVDPSLGPAAPQHNVKNHLVFREGGCWEITACETADGAEVGVNFGCKPLPSAGWTNGCEANGAWSFNANLTITSVMSGKCLEVDPRGNGHRVVVGTCQGEGGSPTQRWRVNGAHIESVGMQGMCIDSNVVSPPPGTTGRCIAVEQTNDIGGAGSWNGVQGPALQVANGQQCVPDQPPGPLQKVEFTQEGRLQFGSLCVGALHGQPTPFGPLQLWSKPQPGGAAAVLLLNRGSESSGEVDIELSTLPGLSVAPRGMAAVRDIWARSDRDPVPGGGSVRLSAAGHDSDFVLLTPAETEYY